MFPFAFLKNFRIFAFMKHLLTIFALLLALCCCTAESERLRMRVGLDSINQRNRNDLPFSVADVQPYVDFFDNHGTSNDRLLAHYLLGRAYHEHGEAPMALQCYHDAIDHAETTAANCDYAQLARVYGQMADIFYYQGLYQEALVQFNNSVALALKGKDTLLALKNSEQTGFVYMQQGDTMLAMSVFDSVAQKFLAIGYPQYAAITLGGNIRPLIDLGNYDKAKECIDMYENLSERFDAYGNIEAGREIYYKSKGLYYLHTNKLDSAEYYFRKEMRDGKDFNNQNAAATGLVQLFKTVHLPDSTAKYALYAYNMLDSIYSQMTSKEVERMQAMHNYTRQQEVARQASEKAASASRRLFVCSIALLAVFLLVTWLYIARKKLIENLQKTVVELNLIKNENSDLRHNATANQQQIAENIERIRRLESKLGKYGKLVYFGIDKAENCLKLSPNYLLIADRRGKDSKLTEVEWDIVKNLVEEYFPSCFEFLIANLSVGSLKFKICLLLRLHFINKEVGAMIGYTAAYSSRLSSEIYKELYGKSGGSKELAVELSKLF